MTNELKAETIVPQGCTLTLQMYPKAEVDKYIGELEEKHKMEVEQLLLEIAQIKRAARTLRKKMNYWKRKFCLVMSWWCASRRTAWADVGLKKQADWYRKWKENWKKLADKFKETK